MASDHTTVMYAVDKIKQQMTERHVIFDQVNSSSPESGSEQWIMLWSPGDNPVIWGEPHGRPRPAIVMWTTVDNGDDELPFDQGQRTLHNPQATTTTRRSLLRREISEVSL